VSEQFLVRSYRGDYRVRIDQDESPESVFQGKIRFHVIIDSKVAEIYRDQLKKTLENDSVLIIQANEGNKTLQNCVNYVAKLLEKRIKRGNRILSIGGGVIQDISCFVSSILMRGIEWNYYPTTLLAQADSCIGSKSSINFGGIKNIVGGYYPPTEVVINPMFLKTLEEAEIRSGLGEILKICALEGESEFEKIAASYKALTASGPLLQRFILLSLNLKKSYIEADEFDTGQRNLLNYGHSFGHAIESSSGFAIPHGVAVSMGMDMANWVSARLGFEKGRVFDKCHATLFENYKMSKDVAICPEKFLSGIGSDKKNSEQGLGVIIPVGGWKFEKKWLKPDKAFQCACTEYLEGLKK